MSATALEVGTSSAPDSVLSASMLVIWQHPRTRRMHPVARLDRSPSGYRFRYLANVRQVEGFRPFMGFPDLSTDYRSERLFPLFAGRAMDPRRPDYHSYLQALGLDANADPWEQVARSEGHQATDHIQVFPFPRRREGGRWECRFLVHGIRHIAAQDPGLDEHLAALVPGSPLHLRPEPSNRYSPRAVLTCDTEDHRLGYVPHFLLDHVEELQRRGPLDLRVATINPPGTPGHLRLAAQLTGTAAPAYEPFNTPEFEPLS